MFKFKTLKSYEYLECIVTDVIILSPGAVSEVFYREATTRAHTT